MPPPEVPLEFDGDRSSEFDGLVGEFDEDIFPDEDGGELDGGVWSNIGDDVGDERCWSASTDTIDGVGDVGIDVDISGSSSARE